MAALIGALRVTLGLDTAAFSDGIKQAQKKLAAAGASMKSVGESLSLKVTAPIALMGGLIVKTAGDFEASMNRVEAATGASADEMASLTKLARDLGKSTTFSAGQAADAIEMLAKNGVSTSDILGGALSASLDLAASSGADLASAADLATDIMLNFKQGVGDLGGVVDGVSGVLLASKFGFDDYRLALAQAGGVAGGLGVSLKDFNAVIAATSARFASGSDAGTSFKTFLQRLVPSSKAAAEAISSLGLEFFNADGSLKGMADIAQELQDALAGLSDEDKSNALSTIFGTDAMRTAIGLMDAGAQGVRDLDAAISSAVAADQAAARTKGFSGALEALGGAFDELQLAIAGSGLLDAVTRFVQMVTEVINYVSELNPRILEFGTIFAGLSAAVGPVVFAMGTLVAILGTAALPVAAVVTGIAALTAAVIAFWPEIVKAKDAVVQFARDAMAGLNEFGDAAAAKIDEVVQSFLGLVDEMAQVGRDVIAGLLAGLREKWEAVKAWFTGLADSIPQWVRDRLGIQSPSTVFAEIGRNIMDGLSNGLTSTMGQVGQSVDSFAQDLASSFADVLTGARDWRDALSSVLSSAGDSLLRSGISGLGTAIGIPGFASGTSFAPGGLALVGEHGPELMNVPRGAKITPNGKLGGLGGSSFTYAPVIDARGADSAGLARLEGQMRAQAAEFQAMFADKTMASVADPRFRGRR